jgi:hypothetical protein
MISRAARRTSCERPSDAPPSTPSAARVSVRMQVFSPSCCPFVGGRSPNRTSCDSPIRRRGTPTLFPAILGLHLRGLGACRGEWHVHAAVRTLRTLHWEPVRCCAGGGRMDDKQQKRAGHVEGRAASSHPGCR